jgi:hypothetical protein
MNFRRRSKSIFSRRNISEIEDRIYIIGKSIYKIKVCACMFHGIEFQIITSPVLLSSVIFIDFAWMIGLNSPGSSFLYLH